MDAAEYKRATKYKDVPDLCKTAKLGEIRKHGRVLKPSY